MSLSTGAVILIAAALGGIGLIGLVAIWDRRDRRDDGFWAQPAPRPSRVEVLTGPGTRIRQTSEVTASVLATGTSPFPMLPPDPEPDPTLTQPHDVRYLGKPSGELVDELFAKYAGGES